jgi:hypothetical protein
MLSQNAETVMFSETAGPAARAKRQIGSIGLHIRSYGSDITLSQLY